MNKKYQSILKEFFYSETTEEYSLEKITRACAYFDNPENSFKSIHIAGTNGKGSTAKMMFQMLKENGNKVGVYTSPHNIDIRERFETANCVLQNKNPPNPLYQGGMRQMGLISEEDFIQYAEKIIAYGGGLSYYEKCVLMAFLYFRDQGCEYTVIEVGMGGRLDATNIITPVLSIITSISYDHMEFLGNTLEEIAYEKGGIIKPGIPVILYGENSTLEAIARERNSRVIFPKKRKVVTNLLGNHQISNARIAYEAGKFLSISDAIIQDALLHVDHQGRLEYIRPNLLIDGAHNEDGMKKLKEYLDALQSSHPEDASSRSSTPCEAGKYPWGRSTLGGEIVYCFNLKKGKSSALVLGVFPEIASWNVVDSGGFRVSKASILIQDIQSHGRSAISITSKEIFEQADKNPRKLFVVFGSLYMMGEFLNR